MTKIRKKSSKRQTLKMKYQVGKFAAEHKRKIKKEAKKRKSIGIVPKCK